MHSILLLGAGFVTKPTLDIILKAGHKVTVACRTLKSAKALSGDAPNSIAISLDVNDNNALDAEVAKHDLVISLIPYTFHAAVIKSAIRNKKMKSMSFITNLLKERELIEGFYRAKQAGITVLNEIGLDPGIDHLYAVKTIDEVHKEGGKIKTFLSYCGGLPAPECSNNPLGYKFSWSSRGVLLALRNSAKFWKDGKIEEIPGKQLMGSAKPYFIYPGYAFIAYANRDSSHYKERYNIPEAETIIRGTLRYQGFTEFVAALVDLGFLNDDPVDYLSDQSSGMTWKDVLAKLLGSSSNKESDLISAISSKHNFKDEADKLRIIAGFRWLGLFSSDPVMARGNFLDTLCATLEQKMQYEAGERDLVMLQHKFEIEHKNGSKETRTSTLVENGDANGGYTAMAKLVGVPCGVAVNMVLDGSISERGVLAPVTPKLAEILRLRLKEEYGIEMIEATIG